MALRGPDGSMMTATDGLYEERKNVFLIFGFGLACTVGSVVLCVWILLHWEAAFCCMCVTLLTGRTIWKNYQRVQKRFSFDENETVDFRDIMEGPAAIQGVPMPISSSYRSKPASFQSHSLLYERNTASPETNQSDWNHGSQLLLKNASQNIKRRGQSESPSSHIQTV